MAKATASLENSSIWEKLNSSEMSIRLWGRGASVSEGGKIAVGSLLVGGVDVMVRVSKCALNGKDGRVTSFLPRSVIAAGVTALGLHIGNREILLDQSFVELG